MTEPANWQGTEARRHHDLRTPMNGVLGMLELLLDTDLDETQRHYVITAQKAARAMLAQLDRRPMAAVSGAADKRWEGPCLDILVAEDDDDSLCVIQAMLEGDGHTVTAVRDGGAAVAAVAARAFDAVILDLFMPGMDGLAATQAIRALAMPRSVPIIGLTANLQPQASQECLAAGMDAVVLKPVERRVLRGLLSELAGKRDGDDAEAPVLDPVWLDEIRAILDPEKLADLVQRAGDSAARFLGSIELAMGQGDGAAVSVHAHRLAGLAAMYGCAELRLEALVIEDAARHGRLGEIQGRLDRLSQITGRSLLALRQAVQRLPA